MWVLDTSALSAVMHRDERALALLQRSEPAAVVLCSPVAAEIQYGLSRLREGSRRRRLLSEEYRTIRAVVRWADWNENAAAHFGRVKAKLSRRGSMIEDLDIVIASIALDLGAAVATRNARRFRQIESLEVEDWG